jgi:replicative DNA helicase
MAKRLDCPVLALAQLNRGVEARDDKRPQLADLRESGSIEQDADTVLFAYREAYYLERRRCADPGAEADRMADLSKVANQLELIIEKQRSGPIGTIDLWCDMASNVVRDPAELHEMDRAA